MNVEISNNKRVEFVIKLHGNGDTPLLLPIDSKFPIEDYNRLLDAEDKPAIDEARRSLAQKIRVFAKDIYEKYIVQPKTGTGQSARFIGHYPDKNHDGGII